MQRAPAEQTSGPPQAAAIRRPALVLVYVPTLALAVAAVAAALSTLPFITLSRVPAGQVVQEGWRLGFVLDSPTTRPRPIDAAMASKLARSISFRSSGSIEILAAPIRVTPVRVSWQEGHTTHTAPGGRITSGVRWRARPDATDGQPGEIDVDASGSAATAPAYRVRLRTGSYELTDDGRYVLRRIRAYRTSRRLSVGRLLASLIPAFPVALLLHAILWSWALTRAKRAWAAKVTPPDPRALPRTFYPNPISPWIGWAFFAAITGVVGSILTAYCIAHRELSPSLDHVMITIESVGLSVGLFVAWLTARSAATVHVDRRTISCTRGFRRRCWVTSRWGDLRSAGPTSRYYRGTTVEWLEITFPEGQRFKVPSDVVDYEMLKEVVAKCSGR
jgi:hypothetical protein